MDPVTLIVAALAAGAAAGLKPTAEQAVMDAYAGVKAFIQSKYPSLNLEPLEQKPESEAKQASTAEDLADAGAGDDNELLERAKALIDTLKQHDRQAAKAIGVDLEEIEAEFLKIQKVRAIGTAVKVHKGKFTGGIDIGEVEAGIEDEPPKD
jgi:hypothetical protein